MPGGKIATFTDIDGDAVTVKFSKPILTAGNVGAIFQFSGSTFASTGPQKLNSLQLANLGADANGVNITITAKRSPVTGGIVAGIDAGADNFYGTADDADASGGIVSRISKLIIRNNVQGTATGGDAFGIEANQIGMVKIGTVTHLPNDPLLSFATGVVLSPTTSDIKLRTL